MPKKEKSKMKQNNNKKQKTTKIPLSLLYFGQLLQGTVPALKCG